MNPALAVVIGTHNRLEQLRRAVASVLEQTTIPVRVYVTDAGSTDGTIAYLEQIADPRFVAVPKASGSSAPPTPVSGRSPHLLLLATR